MSGIQMAVLAAGGGGIAPATSISGSINNTAITTGIRSGSITFNTDGSISGSSYTGSTQWLTSVATGNGAGFHIRVTGSGTNTTYSGNTLNTWIDMGVTNPTFTVANSGSSLEGVGAFTIEVSIDGGTTVLKTYASAVSWDVGYAP